MCLHGGEGGGLCGPNTEPVEAGSGHPSVLFVEELYPGVQLLQVLQVVDEVSGWGAISFKPHKFGGVEDGSNGELVLIPGVEDILPVDDLLEVHEPLDQGIPGGTLQDVVEPSADKHSLLEAVPLVLNLEGHM